MTSIKDWEQPQTNLQIVKIGLAVFRLRDLFIDGDRQPRVDPGLDSQVRPITPDSLS